MGAQFPTTDTGLLAWSLNFQTILTASPTTYGLTAAQMTAYGTLHTNYATALAACDPGQRSKTAVAAKNSARSSLKQSARLLANIIDGQSTVTDAQKIDLGLNVRNAPTPTPAPADAPALDIVSVSGRTVSLRLHDATDASRRGRPAGVAGATIFSFVGATPPAGTAEWNFEGNTTKTNFDVVFPESVAPGTLVWLCAFWRNETDQSGPACSPISTNVQFGSAMAA